ncbi:hypothetical protein DF186_14580, partial [Enterococcus hirae]
VIKKLEIFKIQTAKISLKITDKSIKQTYKLIENILVKIENFDTDKNCLSTNFLRQIYRIIVK